MAVQPAPISERYAAGETLRPIAFTLGVDQRERVGARICNPAHLEPVSTAEKVRRGLNGVLRGAA